MTLYSCGNIYRVIQYMSNRPRIVSAFDHCYGNLRSMRRHWFHRGHHLRLRNNLPGAKPVLFSMSSGHRYDNYHDDKTYDNNYNNREANNYNYNHRTNDHSSTTVSYWIPSGTSFSLNGSKFTVVGENSYWVGLMGYSTTDMNKAFADIASAGSTVVRTWGFNEVTSPNGIYYQSWSGSTPTVNTGASGLANFDNVIAAAKANGIRLIVALTNNWSDYGGMDVYVKQILNSPNHDLFYTDATVKAAFKNYIKAFVGRYLNEPTIMAWELANEPRCKGSTGTSTGTCTTTTVTAWIKEISAYIKSIDTNHLVAVGDEGFYNQPSAPTYPYQGSEGVDFDANLAISTIDFGTFHSYPTSWGQSGNESAWGTQWIADHATSQKKANKPVIIEEFGVTSNQATIYTTWLNQVVSSGLTGELIWQAGSHLTNGDTPNDGYAVYVDGPVFPVIKAAAAQLKARA